MAYEMVMPYHLHMPSYFLETFTEYPFLMMSPVGGAIGPVLMGYVADNSNMSLSFIIPFVSFCVVLFYSWYADVEGN